VSGGRPAARPPRSRPGSAPDRALPPLWAIGCFLVSGAAGLIYEIVWSKQLTYLLGSSLQSVAMVTAAFLGGLALGARLLGTPLARGRDPALRYAQLELAVALAGVALLPLLRSLDAPVGQLYRALGGESAAFAGARLVLLFGLLVPPAALMGATLPVLVARCERGAIGAGLAWLYAVNTLGAVAGSLLAGFLLMPRLGLGGATVVAAALNLFASLTAFVFAARDAGGRAPVPAPVPTAVPPLLAPPARFGLGVLFAASGFAALALQLAWVRLYGLVLGSSVYSFAAVLGVYLAGIALGSAACAPLLTRFGAVPAFAALQLGIAASAAVGMHGYAGLPRAMLEIGERSGASWTSLLLAQLGLVLPVLLVPCVLLGAVFPLAARLLQAGGSGAATGSAYALNTLGTIAGSLLSGFVLLPALGVEGVVRLAVALSLGSGLASLLLPGVRRPRLAASAGLGALALAAVVAAITAPRWDPVLMSLGTYRPFHARNLLASFQAAGGVGDPTRELAAAQRVLFYREGINASVLVASDLEGSRRWLRVGGKIDASTGDMLTQVMLGLLPAAMCDSGARTLVVGHGSGFTAAAALIGGAGRTDIVELEPAVIAGSRLFHESGGDPLDDPRVTLHLEDARTLLAHGGGRYGLVISEPSNPWIAGVNNLFTVDFYRRVRARLADDGVFCQWIQLYELSPGTFHSLLAAFLEVFPNAHLFCLWRSFDVLLIAAPPGRELPLARLRTAGARRELGIARLTDAGQVASFYVGSGAALRALVRGAERNTDDRPIVEYRAPRDLIEVGRGLGSEYPPVLGELSRAVVPPAGGPLAGWPRELELEWRARERLAGADDAAALAVYEELRDAGRLDLAARLAVERKQQLERTRLAALAAEVQRATAAGEPTTARKALEELAANGVNEWSVWLPLAQARRQAGDLAGSGVAAERALALPRAEPAARLEALLLAGMAAQAGHRTARAFECFRAAQALAPRDPRAYDYEARVRFAANDVEGARAVVTRGLAAAPGDPALTQALQALTRAASRR
jgi:spermidine synthase